MEDSLRRAGFRIVRWERGADVMVVNGCAVTSTAAGKTRHAVRSARRRNPRAFVVLAGCTAEPAASEDVEHLPVDLILPNSAKSRLADWLPDSLETADGAPRVVGGQPVVDGFTEPGTAFPGTRTRANLKIQEGCDCGCTYCIVPQVRGAPRSRSRDDVLREADELLESGVKELVLTGVHTSLYQSEAGGLDELVRALLARGDGYRIRLSSLEPGPGIRSLIDLMASESRLCRFLHLPVQHADDGVLERMGRPVGFEEFAGLAVLAVERVPGVCIGTDVIVGFPGETDEEFEIGRHRLRELPLGLLHVFPFSRRPGTPAASLSGQVEAAAMDRRRAAMLDVGRELTHAFATAQTGHRATVLTERAEGLGVASGWSDNYLHVTACAEVSAHATRLGENQLVSVQLHEHEGKRRMRGTVLKID